MLAVIGPGHPVAAVLAALNECCLAPQPSSLQQQQPQEVPSATGQQQRDAVNTQSLQQTLSGTKLLSKQQMGEQPHNDQDAGSQQAAAPSADPAAVSDALLESSNTAAAAAVSLPVKKERRSSRTERRPSRSERKAAAAPVAGYSTDSYWNSRYAERSTHFDWFYNYSALAELIGTACDSEAGRCLHVGCGNSGFSEGMVQDGFQVVNVDISPVVIEQMRLMDQLPGQTWEVADCRSMPQYEDASFGSVLDKGTLDAVLCSSHGSADAAAYISEIYRLLVPGGVFLLVSLGQPQARLAALKAAPTATSATPLPYLSADLQQRAAASSAAAAAAAAAPGISTTSDGGSAAVPRYHWEWESVEVYLLPKPTLYLQSEASLTGKPIISHARHSDKDMPVEALGPFTPGPELDAFVAQQHLDLREFFTAFACTKPCCTRGRVNPAALPDACGLP